MKEKTKKIQEAINLETLEIYKLGRKLGLKKNDMDLILNDVDRTEEKSSFSTGPPEYMGAHYGSISINDF